MLYNKKILNFISLLSSLGYISYILVDNNDNVKKYLMFTPFFFKNTSFYGSLSLISTPTKRFSLTVRALIILNRSLKSSFLILETSRGLLTHKEALKYHTGGYILCLLS